MGKDSMSRSNTLLAVYALNTSEFCTREVLVVDDETNPEIFWRNPRFRLIIRVSSLIKSISDYVP